MGHPEFPEKYEDSHGSSPGRNSKRSRRRRNRHSESQTFRRPSSTVNSETTCATLECSDLIDSHCAAVALPEVRQETVSPVPTPLPATVQKLASQSSAGVESTATGSILAERDVQSKVIELRTEDTQADSAAKSSTKEETVAAPGIHDELKHFSEELRSDLNGAVQQLSKVSRDTAHSQGEVLRTLTEAIFTSSAHHGLRRDDVETMLFALETRLADRFRETLHAVLPEFTLSSAAPAASASSREISASQKDSGNSTRSGNTDSASTALRDRLQSDTSAAKRSVSQPAVMPAKSWDDIRRELLSGSDKSTQDDTHHGDGAASIGRSSSENSDNCSSSETESTQSLNDDDELNEILNHQIHCDPDTAPESELREIMKARESLISQLISRLRRRTILAGDGLSVDQLRVLASEVPEVVAEKIRQTLQRLDQQVRMGELELSLERARVARLATQLETSRHQIERNARQLGLTINPDGTIAGSAAAAGKNAGSRRWLGKLGFGE
jgi:hypothetical protein